MDEAEIIGRLEKIIRAVAESEGADLVELTLSGGRRRRMLRVFVDRPGGITVDECARLNRLIGAVLDVEDLIDGPYVLEVSSPGLDRPLKTDRDFERSTGCKVRVILATGATHTGVLRGVVGDTVVLEVAEETLALDRHSIAKANLEIEF